MEATLTDLPRTEARETSPSSLSKIREALRREACAFGRGFCEALAAYAACSVGLPDLDRRPDRPHAADDTASVLRDSAGTEGSAAARPRFRP